MSLLTVVKLSLSFAGKPVFTEIGFQLEPRDRIGLVGPNGAGKTTLLRLVTGAIAPDKGEVRIAKGARLGYLPQDAQGVPDSKLLQSVLDSTPGRVDMQKDLEKIETSLKSSSQKEEQTRLAERLAEIHQEKNQLELDFPCHEAEKILLGLGFKISDFDRRLSSLSGGWQTRAALGRLLFQKPDLLLLDEPTNHLDIPSVWWLEQFLHGYGGAMILVSHDKDFLNRQIQRTIGLESEGMRSYAGNYDAYLKAREEERRTLEAGAKKQEQRVKDAEKFIERFRYKAGKARQAQSKIKLLKKMELVQTHKNVKTTRFSFPDIPRSGRVVLSIKDLSKGFKGISLYENLNLSVLRGDRIALIGPNGCGKTTLLKIVAGEIKPDKGAVSIGHGVIMGYFAQHHSTTLDLKKTVIQEVYSDVPEKTIGFVRGVCGAFLFSGEDVEKPISVLSGGERARVSLAKLLVKPGNFMAMDEPTNHLDITSSEALTNALVEYRGTLLFVSHNQSFVNRLATRIWDVRQGKIIEYPGNLDDYYRHTSQDQKYGRSEQLRDPLPGDKSQRPQPLKNARDRKREKRESAEKRRRIHDTLKPILLEVEKLEEGIAVLEARLQRIEKALVKPDFFSDKDKSISLLGEYKAGKEELEGLLLKWEKSQDKLESVKKELNVGEL